MWREECSWHRSLPLHRQEGDKSEKSCMRACGNFFGINDLYLLYCAALSSGSLFSSVCKFQGQKVLWSNMFVKHWQRAMTDLSLQQRYTVDLSYFLCVTCNDHFTFNVLHWCPWLVTYVETVILHVTAKFCPCVKFKLHVFHT